MSDKVVYLTYKNRETTEEGIDFAACKHCRNKTFTITHDTLEFPLIKCAACGNHIGRMGWAEE